MKSFTIETKDPWYKLKVGLVLGKFRSIFSFWPKNSPAYPLLTVVPFRFQDCVHIYIEFLVLFHLYLDIPLWHNPNKPSGKNLGC
jgi:hypothetical protein